MIGVQTFNVQCEEYLLDKYFLQIIRDDYMVLGFENISMAADAHGVGWYVLLSSPYSNINIIDDWDSDSFRVESFRSPCVAHDVFS